MFKNGGFNPLRERLLFVSNFELPCSTQPTLSLSSIPYYLKNLACPQTHIDCSVKESRGVQETPSRLPLIAGREPSRPAQYNYASDHFRRSGHLLRDGQYCEHERSHEVAVEVGRFSLAHVHTCRGARASSEYNAPRKGTAKISHIAF